MATCAAQPAQRFLRPQRCSRESREQVTLAYVARLAADVGSGSAAACRAAATWFRGAAASLQTLLCETILVATPPLTSAGQHSSPVHFTQLTHRPRGAIKRDKIVLKSDLTLTPLGYNVFDYTRFENHSKNLLLSRMLLCYLIEQSLHKITTF